MSDLSPNILNLLATIAPFVFFALLWFFLLRRMMRKGGQPLSESMRTVVREEVVSELRALRESIESLRKDIDGRR